MGVLISIAARFNTHRSIQLLVVVEQVRLELLLGLLVLLLSMLLKIRVLVLVINPCGVQ